MVDASRVQLSLAYNSGARFESHLSEFDPRHCRRRSLHRFQPSACPIKVGMAQKQQQREDFKVKASQFFDEADTAGTGCLDRLGLCKVVRRCGCDKEIAEISSWFDDLDANEDGMVTKEEFMRAVTETIPVEDVTEAQLREAFQRLDTDGSNCISKKELQAALEQLGEDPENAELGAMDEDGDGRVNFEEFLRCFIASSK